MIMEKNYQKMKEQVSFPFIKENTAYNYLSNQKNLHLKELFKNRENSLLLQANEVCVCSFCKNPKDPQKLSPPMATLKCFHA